MKYVLLVTSLAMAVTASSHESLSPSHLNPCQHQILLHHPNVCPNIDASNAKKLFAGPLSQQCPQFKAAYDACFSIYKDPKLKNDNAIMSMEISLDGCFKTCQFRYGRTSHADLCKMGCDLGNQLNNVSHASSHTLSDSTSGSEMKENVADTDSQGSQHDTSNLDSSRASDMDMPVPDQHSIQAEAMGGDQDSTHRQGKRNGRKQKCVRPHCAIA